MPGSANSVGQIALDLGLNDSKFKKQTKGLEKSTKKAFTGLTSFLSNFLANVATNILNKVLGSIGDFVKSSINLASDLQEVENVVDTVFSSMEREVDSFAKSAMESFGLSELVAKQYMGQLGAMAKAFGYSEKEAYNLARSITGLTGDVASFYNLSTDEAFTKLKSIFTGETESLKSLGIVMTQSALDAFALANGFGKTTSEMSESEKVALRYKFVMNQLSSAQGDFAKTSDSWANQTRVLSLQFDVLKSTLGEGLIVALTPAVQMLNVFIKKLQEVAAGFTAVVKHIFGVTDQTVDIGAGAGVASDATGEMTENLEDAEKAAESTKKSLLGFDEINKLSSDSSDPSAKGDIGEFDWGDIGSDIDEVTNNSTNKFVQMYENFTNTIETMSKAFIEKMKELFAYPIEMAKGQFEAYVELAKSIFGVFSEAITRSFENIKEGFTTLFNGIVDLISSVAGVVSDMAATTATVIADWIEKNNETLVTFLSNFMNTASKISGLTGTIFSDLGSSLRTWWENEFKPVFEGFIGIILDVQLMILDFWNSYVQPVLDNLIEKLSDLWDNSLKPLWDNILSLIASVGNFLVQLWNLILKPLVEFVISVIGPKFKEVFNAIIDVVAIALTYCIDRFSTTIKMITDVLNGFIKFISGVFSGDFEKAWEGILDIFKGIANGMIGFFEGAINGIINILNMFLSRAFDGINKKLEGVLKGAKKFAEFVGLDTSSWITSLSIPSVSIPKISIPRLAEGGFLRANQPTLAVVGDNRREGEIVAPESKIAEAVARGIAQAMGAFQSFEGGSQPLEVIVQIGDETLIDKVINGINRENRRAGRVIIKA